MKKNYHIELRERDSIFTDMVLDASMSNGGDYIPLWKIAEAANFLCRKYPTTGQMHSVNLIGNNVLTIDKGTQNILVITEVEVFDLADEEAKDILDELAPTLHRQTGLLDENNSELLN